MRLKTIKAQSMRIVMLLLLLAVPAFCQQVTNGITWTWPKGDVYLDYMKHVERICETTNETFMVTYDYTTEHCFVPATNPPGEPHYDAKVMVFKIGNGKRVQVGEKMSGTYVEKGCFEDVPAEYVRRALEFESKKKQK